jgi:hypothetical protein
LAVGRAVTSAGHRLRRERLCGLCGIQASLELFASVALFVGNYRYLLSPTCEMARMWIPLGVLAGTKVIRDGVAVAAPYVSQRFGRPAGQWHPKIVIFVLVVSIAVLLGQTLSMIRWRLSPECPSDVDGQARSRTLVMAARLAFAFADAMLSGLWFASWPAPQAAGQRPLPKPPVTTFVVRDVASECGDRVCAICLDEFSPGCVAGRLPCNHVFHDHCCRKWLENGHRQARCPMRCSFTPSSPRDEGQLESAAPSTGRAMDLESNEGPRESNEGPATVGAIVF